MSGPIDPDAVYHQLKAVQNQTRREHFESALIRWWDGDMNINIEVRSDIFSEGEDPVYAVGGATCQVPYRSPEGYFAYDWVPADADLNMTVEVHGYDDRVGYKALSVDLVTDEDGTEWVEVTFVSFLAYWESQILMAMPLLPAALQLPKLFAIPGDTRTVYLLSFWLNLLQTYSPLWRVPDSVTPEGIADSIDPSRWPLVVAPTGLLGTFTKPTITSWRFDMALPAMTQGLKDAECIPIARPWLVGDRQPFPQYMRLSRNCVIIDIEHHPRTPGLVGTLLGGLIQLVVSLGTNLVTQVTHPVLDPNAMPALPSQHALGNQVGLPPAQPWPVYRLGQYSGLVGTRVSKKKSTGTIFWTGGRSPEWVNQGITLAITTALSYIGWLMAIPGLAHLYQGQLDNVVLAFAKVEDTARARRAGRFALKHVWCAEGSTGFGISTALALRKGWYDSRPRIVRHAEIIDGFPYLVGKHIRKGTMCCFEMPDGSLYIDQITNIKWRRDEETAGLRRTLVVGDDDEDEDPIAQLWRHANDLREIAKKLFLEK